MGKKTAADKQLSFDFEDPDRKIFFKYHQGSCRCGYSGKFSKADIVLEMTIPCPQCGSIIRIA